MKNTVINVLTLLMINIVLDSCHKEMPMVHTEELLSDTVLYTLDIDLTNEVSAIKASSFFDSIMPICLETKENVLLGNISKLVKEENRFFVLDKTMAKGVFVFDGEGNFLFQIGKLGQGPGEYTSISDFSIDTQQRLIYILDHHAVEAHVYMLDKGEYVKSIRLDGNNSRSFHLEVCDSSIYMDAYYPSGTSNKEKYMLCRTNMNNEQKVFWLNCLDYNLGWDQIHFVSPIFYNQLDGNGVKFVQPFMHTVMNITHNGVQPYLRLQSKNWITQTDLNETEGDASVRYINLSQKNRINNINSVFEFGNYLFLKYDEGGRMNYLFYDKSTANLSHSSTFVNDLLYEDTNTSGVNLNFCFADSTGLYGYIHPFSMERLLQARDAGNISDRIDNQLHHLTSESNPVLFYLSTPR